MCSDATERIHNIQRISHSIGNKKKTKQHKKQIVKIQSCVENITKRDSVLCFR